MSFGPACDKCRRNSRDDYDVPREKQRCVYCKKLKYSGTREEVLQDLRMLTAFLVADRAPGEQSWKSPFVSVGSAIHQVIEQYQEA